MYWKPYKNVGLGASLDQTAARPIRPEDGAWTEMRVVADLLLRRATKGDKEALSELFALGERYQAEGRFEEASTAFRESAISYRIASFRNRTRAEEAQRRATWLGTVREIYQKWIDANPNGQRDWKLVAGQVDDDCIRRVVVDQLQHEAQFEPLFIYVDEALSSLQLEFYSAGNVSVQRKVWVLLGELFGIKPSSQCVNNLAVRIGLDQLAKEVVNRCHNERSNEPPADGR